MADGRLLTAKERTRAALRYRRTHRKISFAICAVSRGEKGLEHRMIIFSQFLSAQPASVLNCFEPWVRENQVALWGLMADGLSPASSQVD